MLFQVIFMGETSLTSLFCTFVWPVSSMAWFVLLQLALEREGFVAVATLELAINMFVRMQLQGTLCLEKLVALIALKWSMLLLEMLV